MENYNKIYNEVKKSEELEHPTETTETVEQPAERMMGVVTECAMLNVREEPYAEASILCTINLATEVEIDELESTEDFYKIYTASGIEGFCMKQFIAV